jgi:hypothetical protein
MGAEVGVCGIEGTGYKCGARGHGWSSMLEAMTLRESGRKLVGRVDMELLAENKMETVESSVAESESQSAAFAAVSVRFDSTRLVSTRFD